MEFLRAPPKVLLNPQILFKLKKKKKKKKNFKKKKKKKKKKNSLTRIVQIIPKTDSKYPFSVNVSSKYRHQLKDVSLKNYFDNTIYK